MQTLETLGADPALFRRSVARFATGVAVVSTWDELERPQAMTVSSFTSISLEPPTVLVSLRPGRTQTLIRRRGAFGVSVLGAGQAGWSRHFGGRPEPGLAPAWQTRAELPLLQGSLAWFACESQSLLQVHDHTLFVARVLDCGHAEGEPLMFFASQYHHPSHPGPQARQETPDAQA